MAQLLFSRYKRHGKPCKMSTKGTASIANTSVSKRNGTSTKQRQRHARAVQQRNNGEARQMTISPNGILAILSRWLMRSENPFDAGSVNVAIGMRIGSARTGVGGLECMV